MSDFLDKLLSGEIQPQAISKQEELKRLQMIVTAISDRIFDMAEDRYPGVEKYISKTIRRIEELTRELNQAAA